MIKSEKITVVVILLIILSLFVLIIYLSTKVETGDVHVATPKHVYHIIWNDNEFYVKKYTEKGHWIELTNPHEEGSSVRITGNIAISLEKE